MLFPLFRGSASTHTGIIFESKGKAWGIYATGIRGITDVETVYQLPERVKTEVVERYIAGVVVSGDELYFLIKAE